MGSLVQRLDFVMYPISKMRIMKEKAQYGDVLSRLRELIHDLEQDTAKRS
jgi:hypothetical protein